MSDAGQVGGALLYDGSSTETDEEAMAYQELMAAAGNTAVGGRARLKRRQGADTGSDSSAVKLKGATTRATVSRKRAKRPKSQRKLATSNAKQVTIRQFLVPRNTRDDVQPRGARDEQQLVAVREDVEVLGDVYGVRGDSVECGDVHVVHGEVERGDVHVVRGDVVVLSDTQPRDDCGELQLVGNCEDVVELGDVQPRGDRDAEQLVDPRKTLRGPFSQKRPHLLPYWDSQRNGVMPAICDSKTRALWRCMKDPHHRFDAAVESMISNRTCRVCSKLSVCMADFCNSLAVEHFDSVLLSEWDPKNGDPKHFTSNSSATVAWICSKDNHHRWEKEIRRRTGPSALGCPICSNAVVCSADYCNSLAVMFPELVAEWDPDNGDPRDFVSGSQAIVSWICSTDEHHKWEAPICRRTRRSRPTGCPICSNREVCQEDFCNSLYLKAFADLPHLIFEWHSKKNKKTMFEVLYGAREKVWWRCAEGHEWQAAIYARVRHLEDCKLCYRKTWKSEAAVREIFEDIIGRKFPSDEPDFLRTATSSLELDGFCKEESLAFERDGAQHERFIPYFHKDISEFHAQQERDARKTRLCEENGVYLIRVPSQFTHRNKLAMRAFIEAKIDEWRQAKRDQL